MCMMLIQHGAWLISHAVKTKSIFLCISEKKQKNNNHKLETWTFSERSEYINVLNSRFALNHRGKNVLNQPSNLRFRSIVVIILYTTRYDIIMARC